MKPRHLLIALLLFAGAHVAFAQTDYTDKHRPLIHFSPKANWMNDPNGMVYVNNTWHLFYQYYPEGTVWGPMHWGHAESKDLVRWTEKPIALYPDELGYIFSGSAVVDVKNTTGFGSVKNPPLVAIFTHHDPLAEKAGRNDFENQSLAYSLDHGATWTKYKSNPVLKSPGIRDFRDPKVMWHSETNKWIMTLATTDEITFYSSSDMKSWTKESTFGKTAGAHRGVWECPDLFTLNNGKDKVWVLIVNINPGGPNGGSATQYFTGKFDGHTFTPNDTETRWLDHGPDEYAGVTFSAPGEEKIFMGWMSNWQYATKVPTEKWRSAMTIARTLGTERVNGNILVTSTPIKNISLIKGKEVALNNLDAANLSVTATTGKLTGPAMISFSTDNLKPFTLTLSNGAGEKLIIGFDATTNQYFIDRTQSGDVSFEKGFAGRHTVPRFSGKTGMDMTLVIDNASVELFADGGLSVMTEIFFPSQIMSDITIQSADQFRIKSLTFAPLKNAWLSK